MTILNISHKKDLITIDFRLKQIRYLKDFQNHGEILFFDYGQDLETLSSFIGNDNQFVKKVIKEEVMSIWGRNLSLKEMEIIKNEK